jgi:hypothetical protein
MGKKQKDERVRGETIFAHKIRYLTVYERRWTRIPGKNQRSAQGSVFEIIRGINVLSF